MGYGHAVMCCSLCWTCIGSTWLSAPLSSLITHCCFGDKRYQLQHLLYLVAFAGQEGRCVICSSVRCPWGGNCCLSACTLISSLTLVCRYLRGDIWHDHIWPHQAFWMSPSGLFLNNFWKTVCRVCDCFHRNHNLWKYTASDFRHCRLHGNTCLTSRINMGYFCVKPE